MQGDIRVRSKVGRGSSFGLAFPVRVAPEVDAIANLGENVIKGAEVLAGKGYIILDDIPENTYILAEALKKYGVRPTVCVSGVDALALFRASPFDGVITDLRMPLMSGQTFIVELRQFERETKRPAVPVVVVTAETALEEKKLCLGKYGANEFLLKPVKLHDLVSAMVRLHSQGGSVARKRERRILLVDDDVIGSQFMSTILTRAGHRCSQAHSVQEAISMLQEDEKTEGVCKYDIVVLDSFLGDGTGADFLRLVRTSGRKMPKVISVSGNTIDDQRRMYEGCPVDGFVQKPAKKQDVLEMVAIL